jgi:hypothetical protein
MSNQGRLIKVMLLLIAAMTAGALVLLGLEGKPIKPMAYSLSSQARLSPLHTALDTESGLTPGRWQQIEYTYLKNAGQLTSRFGPTGSLATGYHFIISDGSVGNDGQIFPSLRWRRQLSCQKPDGSSCGNGNIRICVIRSRAFPTGTPQQNRRLVNLVSKLTKNCQIAIDDIVLVK